MLSISLSIARFTTDKLLETALHRHDVQVVRWTQYIALAVKLMCMRHNQTLVSSGDDCCTLFKPSLRCLKLSKRHWWPLAGISLTNSFLAAREALANRLVLYAYSRWSFRAIESLLYRHLDNLTFARRTWTAGKYRVKSEKSKVKSKEWRQSTQVKVGEVSAVAQCCSSSHWSPVWPLLSYW